jgi:peptide/nickel transport system ATP-binding protein
MAGTGTSHLRRDDALLRVEHLEMRFPLDDGQEVHAVADVSLDLMAGETLGIVGESGSGKSTLGRAILQLPPPTAGSVRLDGTELTELDGERLRHARTTMQMIFQDPISSLNPRRRVHDILTEGPSIWGRDVPSGRVEEMLRLVGLDPATAADRRPHEFSGGQCQRIAIARALMLEPTVLLCDEVVSALDVSVQAQILNLLLDLKDRYGLAVLFIAHDLGVVRAVADRVAVMYLGRLCEVGPPDSMFDAPAHPYTASLIASIPEPDAAAAWEGTAIAGEPPSPIDPPTGCRFRTRCPHAQDRCAQEVPTMTAVAPGHHVACHFPLGTATELVPPNDTQTPIRGESRD